MAQLSEDTVKPSLSESLRDTEISKRVESFTAQVPTITYVALAVGSMALSVSIAGFTERKWLANFVGSWVPTLLLIGIYNKLTKLESPDSLSNANLH